MDGRWLPTRRRNCGLETFGPVGFARPDQARKPCHIVCTIHVERVEVDPCPPGNLEALLRQRYRPHRSARQRGRSRVRAR